MSDKIKLSVLITYYNQKKFVQDSLESVLRQKTDFDYEILIGDDGSTDGTYELLVEYEKRYNNISLYSMERNVEAGVKFEPITRVSQNRLFLLKKAQGEYVSFLDGDDYYLNDNKLQYQIGLLESNGKLVACGGPVLLKYGDSSKDKIDCFYFKKNIVLSSKEYWMNFWFHADTFIYKSAYIMDFFNTINQNVFDDNLITCYFLPFGDIQYITETTVAYRQQDDSSWGDRNESDKLLVNIIQYVEGIRILHWRKCCFLRNYWELKALYCHRKQGIRIENIDAKLLSALLSNNFVRDTIEYSKKSNISRLVYDLFYYIPFHSDRIVRYIKEKHLKKLRLEIDG